MAASKPLQRPGTDEYAPFYEGYVNLVGPGDPIELLDEQLARALGLFGSLSDGDGDRRYAPGKWSIKEVLGHVIDAEWIFTHRALCFARGLKEPLPGMDQEEFARGSNAGRRSLASLLGELQGLRQATRELFASLAASDPQAFDRIGRGSGVEFTVRALLYIVLGHAEHHLGVLQERYGLAPP